ncbi:MAG: hypothetical protein D6732_20225 [Methanobacteriota archaeon]|nr:MAG: hypothetical protein D6732_20225 [Euryarchaeota archaeon]
MQRYGKTTFWLTTLLLLSSFTVPMTGLDLGPVDSALIPANIPLDVTLKFWGFSSDLIWQSLQLPSQMVIETMNENTDLLQQYYEVIFGYPFAWKIDINYHVEVNPEPISKLIDFFSRNSTMMVDVPVSINGTTQFITGKGMKVTDFSEFLHQFDENEGYTMHVIDGSIFMNTSDDFHWYYYSQDGSYHKSGGDFRNVGAISPTSLFYDVNAFAPAFMDLPAGSQRMVDTINSTYSVNKFIEDRVTPLIENVIIGSPLYRRFGFVSYSSLPRLHFSKIVVGDNNSLTETYQIHKKTGDNGFSNKLQSFFSFYPKPIEIKEDYTFLDDNSRLKAFIDNNFHIINGTKSIIMDSRLGEELKNAIRTDRSIYTAFPSGFFFLSVVFNFQDPVRFLYNTSKGLREYSADLIGLDIIDISKWKNMGVSERVSTELSDFALRSVGKLLGLPVLKDGISAFIETPMSDYGFGKTKNGKDFTGVEMMSYFRKLIGWFNLSSVLLFNTIMAKLENQKLEFIPHEELFTAEAERVNATILWYRGQYAESVRQYLIAFENMTKAIKTVEQRIAAFKNTILWASGIFFLFAIHNLMITSIQPPRSETKRTKQGIPISWYRSD